MEDDFQLKGPKLYDDGKIRIHANRERGQEHGLVISGHYINIPRGVLKEVARGDRQTYERVMRNICPAGIERILEKSGLIREDLRVGFCQALIAEQEEYAGYLLMNRTPEINDLSDVPRE